MIREDHKLEYHQVNMEIQDLKDKIIENRLEIAKLKAEIQFRSKLNKEYHQQLQEATSYLSHIQESMKDHTLTTTNK